MSMTAGQYYIGDLCYVMHDVWDEVCDLLFPDDVNSQQGEFTLKDGRRFAIYNTQYGDGEYDTTDYGNTICVDSGTIGCILLSDIMAEKYDDIQRLGSIVEITEDFSTGGGRGTKEWDGVIHIGPIHIETSPEYEDYE